MNSGAVVRKLYLDIDGVLLGRSVREGADMPGIALAEHAHELLELCLSRFDCYWLTTHGRQGDIEPIMRVLTRYADESFLALAKRVKPASWNTLKTEAIDFACDFFWIEDEILFSEKEVLVANNALENWVYVNTRNDPGSLAGVIERLADDSMKSWVAGS